MKSKKQKSLLPMFRTFINESKSGKRLKSNGTRIKPSTINSYEVVEKTLASFCEQMGKSLLLHVRQGNSIAAIKREKKYWDTFYREYNDFLYKRGYADNYVGMHFKILRVFFRYLTLQKGILISENYKSFYVIKVETPVITLSLDQLRQLINDIEFYNSLTYKLKRTRDIFIFGCSVGLRISDLSSLVGNNLIKEANGFYLVKKSIKTGVFTRIKLPEYCIKILFKYSGKQKNLLPLISLSQFNKNLKELGEIAGWTWEVGKETSKQGIFRKCKTRTGKEFRFCDLMSSHMMRKTTITSMLLLGMPEPVVRKLSGHAANSKEFYRYVKYSQSYLDEHTDAVFEKLRFNK